MNVPVIKKFFEKFYIEDECVFDFKKNDSTLTVSGSKGIDAYSRKCHVLEHIGDDGSREHWAVEKISTAIAFKKGDDTAKHGSYEPSWFEDEYAVSDYLEYFLNSEKDLPKFLRWIKDRDINYFDNRENRYVVDLEFKEVTGLAICAHTSYKDRFECHGVRFVFEYTANLKDGEFAVYDAYPILTKKDKEAVKKAAALFKK